MQGPGSVRGTACEVGAAVAVVALCSMTGGRGWRSRTTGPRRAFGSAPATTRIEYPMMSSSGDPFDQLTEEAAKFELPDCCRAAPRSTPNSPAPCASTWPPVAGVRPSTSTRNRCFAAARRPVPAGRRVGGRGFRPGSTPAATVVLPALRPDTGRGSGAAPGRSNIVPLPKTYPCGWCLS